MKQKTIFFLLVLACTALNGFAQDSFFDGSSTELSETTPESTDFFTDDSGSTGSAGKSEFSGFARLGIRMYPHNALKRTAAVPEFGVHYKYNGSKTELDVQLTCNARTFPDYPLDLLNELTMRAYLGDVVLSAGKMKVVWGRGDMLHVLDPFNANDFTDFTIPDYIDRRIGEPMVHIAYNAPIPLRLEGVWTPIMTPDRFAKEGVWAPRRLETSLDTIIKGLPAPYQSLLLPKVHTDILPAMQNMLPDTRQLQYGQYGLRLSGSAGPVDMAAQYYYGHYKTPSFAMNNILTAAGTSKPMRNWASYDQVHIFGADLGAAIGFLNLRSECAYYMTNDTAGDDPAVHNNSLQWLLGFDMDIPLHNLNINVQNIGSYTIGFNKVKDNINNKKIDMDWNTAEKSTNNKLVCKISDSWLHNTLEDSVTVIWGIEHNDVIVMPRIKYKIKDDFYVEGSGGYVYAQDKKSEFSPWKNNHFVQLGFEYTF